MWANLEETADLVTFTEKILNGKFHFLCSDLREYSDQFKSFIFYHNKQPAGTQPKLNISMALTCLHGHHINISL